MPIPPDWSRTLRAYVEKLKADPNRPLGDEPFGHFVLTERANSWNAFINWSNDLAGSWCFRGQREAAWLLHPSQDRATLVEYNFKYSSGYYHLDRRRSERELLFQFKQRAHHYLKHVPADEDLASWLGMMQHHGIPTRLLDWTHSAFVALYFALEEPPQQAGRRSAVWAINLDWLVKKGHELLPSGASDAAEPDTKAAVRNRLLERTEKPVIISIDPQHADQRMAAQQGFFLCKLIGEASFNQMLMTMMIHPDTPDHPVVRKLEISGKNRIGFLKRLRTMNIHRASLFPDLDGFCRFLALNMEITAKEAAEDPGPSFADLQKELTKKDDDGSPSE
jgi:hypothetical protein